jgi:hypothetical protein
VYHSILDLRVIQKKKEEGGVNGSMMWTRFRVWDEREGECPDGEELTPVSMHVPKRDMPLHTLNTRTLSVHLDTLACKG